MVVRYDPTKGQVIDDQAVMGQTQAPLGLDPIAEKKWLESRQLEQADVAFRQGAASGANKPMFAANPLDELGNIVGNAGTGLLTDFLDIGAGLADTAVQVGNVAQGKSWDWDNFFNDSDNPWTQWRQDNFEAQSQAGKVGSDLLRIGTMVLTLPKVGIKGLAMLPKVVRASKLPLAADIAGDVVKGLDKADDFLNATKATKATAALEGLDLAKGTAAGKAAARAGRNTWLQATYADVAQNTPEMATWWQSVAQSSKALTQLTRGAPKANIKTMSQALAWDAFAAFNVYGEGDSQFDETLTDTLAGMGLPALPFLQTDINDSSWARKVKQMAEGLVMGSAINALVDTARVYQFSRAFSKAGVDERSQIIKALNAEADELGSGIAGLLPPTAESLQYDRALEGVRQTRLEGIQAAVDTQRIANSYQKDLDVAQLMANQRMAAGAQDALPGTQPAGLLPEGAAVETGQPVLPGVQSAGALPEAYRGLPPGSSPEPKPPGADPAGLLGAGGGELIPPVQQVDVQVVGPRPPEPTVTPQTIRNAFEADAREAFRLTFEEGPDGIMRSLADMDNRVKQLMPRTRVDAVEYITTYKPRANDLGVIPAADSKWVNFITNRGLQEGWASIDPDTMAVRFNRKSALDIDRAAAAAKQAEAMDQLNELTRYEEWLWNKELVNGAPQMRPEVQDNLAAKEARDAYDQWEAGQSAARAMEPDPARADAERRLVTAGVEADQLDAAEELRLSEAEVAQATGAMDDATVVRELLGTTLDSIQAPEVLKAEVGRGWEVFGADGEVIARATTKREANKIAQAELERSRQALINRARQMEADATDEALNVTTGTPIYESDLVGKVNLTEAQIDAIQKFSPSIQSAMRADWEKRTGGQAFYNINDLKGGSKKTFELTQGEMYDIADGIKALLQTGEITGPKARVLKNIADKLSTSMKLLEPQARAQRFANDITADAKRFIDHGDFC